LENIHARWCQIMIIARGSAAHPRRIDKTSEFIGAVLFLLSIGIQQVAPMQTPHIFASCLFYRPSGFILVCSSVLVLRGTLAELAKHKQPHEPGKATTRLVITGPFQYSRNPTYASIVLLLQPGLAICFDNTWMNLLIPVSMLAFWYILIRDEEEYLRTKFREEWVEYCQTTRRWI